MDMVAALTDSLSEPVEEVCTVESPTEFQIEPWREAFEKGLPFVVDGVEYNRDAEVAAWVDARAGGEVVESARPGARAFGVLGANGTRVAGVSYFHPRGRDIEAAVAVDDLEACRPAVFRRILGYAFDPNPAVGLGCTGISIEVEWSNTRCIRAAYLLGCVPIGQKPHVDRVLMVLAPNRCPFTRHLGWSSVLVPACPILLPRVKQIAEAPVPIL